MYVSDEPGFYKEPANVVICEPICVKVFIDRIKPKTSREEDLTFITKDGIKMSVSASNTWFVDDPELVHKSGGQAGGEHLSSGTCGGLHFHFHQTRGWTWTS